MNQKSKKVLASQGAGVKQALSWIGGAIFGDTDAVLDDIAACGDATDDARRLMRTVQAPRPVASTPVPRRRPQPKPEPEVITIEEFEVTEGDDE